MAATLEVGPTAPFTTIGAAVAVAAAGDTVEIHAGTYTEDLTIDRAIDLVGLDGPDLVLLVSAGGREVLKLTDDVDLTGIGIHADGAQGILVTGPAVGRVTFTDIAITGAVASAATYGGAINVYDGRLTVVDSTFTDNRGAVGGAIYAGDGVTIRGSTFERNVADDEGGAVFVTRLFNQDSVRLTGNTFDGNTSLGLNGRGDGGALYFYVADVGTGSTNQIARNTFCNNVAADLGGALTVESELGNGTAAEVLVEDNLFVENDARKGGAASFVQSATGYLYAGTTPATIQFRQNTLLGNAATVGAHVFVGRNVNPKVTNDLFAFGDGGAALHQTTRAGRRDYLLFFGNGGGDFGGGLGAADLGLHTVIGQDPLLAAYSEDGDCGNDDTSLLPGSPAIDAGNPLFLDPDGTVSDIGWSP